VRIKTAASAASRMAHLDVRIFYSGPLVYVYYYVQLESHLDLTTNAEYMVAR